MLIFYFQPSPVISVHLELIICLCNFGSRNRCSSLVGGTFSEFFSHFQEKSGNVLAMQTSVDLGLSSTCDCNVGCCIFAISTTIKLAEYSILLCPSCFSVRAKLTSRSRVITCLNSRRNIANFGYQKPANVAVSRWN